MSSPVLAHPPGQDVDADVDSGLQCQVHGKAAADEAQLLPRATLLQPGC